MFLRRDEVWLVEELLHQDALGAAAGELAAKSSAVIMTALPDPEHTSPVGGLPPGHLRTALV
jgi:hypothetical protein